VEPTEQVDACCDQDSAHDQGAQHSPIEDLALLGRWGPELGEDQDEDEDVVDRKRLFQQVRGEVRRRRTHAVKREDDEAEPDRQTDPGAAPQRGGAQRRRLP